MRRGEATCILVAQQNHEGEFISVPDYIFKHQQILRTIVDFLLSRAIEITLVLEMMTIEANFIGGIGLVKVTSSFCHVVLTVLQEC